MNLRETFRRKTFTPSPLTPAVLSAMGLPADATKHLRQVGNAWVSQAWTGDPAADALSYQLNVLANALMWDAAMTTAASAHLDATDARRLTDLHEHMKPLFLNLGADAVAADSGDERAQSDCRDLSAPVDEVCLCVSTMADLLLDGDSRLAARQLDDAVRLVSAVPRRAARNRENSTIERDLRARRASIPAGTVRDATEYEWLMNFDHTTDPSGIACACPMCAFDAPAQDPAVELARLDARRDLLAARERPNSSWGR